MSAISVLIPGAFVVHLYRRACLSAFRRVGEGLAHRVHGRDWRALLEPGASTTFAERCFYATVHVACTLLGGWACSDWLVLPGTLLLAPPWPRALPPHRLAGTYLMLEGALALESSVCLALDLYRRGAARRRMMTLHHALVLLLVAMSWRLGILEVGAVVLWLHSASDVPIDALKAVGALQWRRALLPAWAVATVSWLGFRLVYLPLHVLWPGLRLLWSVDPTGTREYVPGAIAWSGLAALFALHVVWFAQLWHRGGARYAPCSTAMRRIRLEDRRHGSRVSRKKKYAL